MRNAIVVALALASLAFAEARPKVRAITAFINIDAAHYEAQVAEAVKFLNAARDEYKAAGFEVETIRVVTQPLAGYTRGMKHADALALLRKYGELAAKLGFSPNLGAVQLTDEDDRATVDLAIDVFASTKINGSLVVGGGGAHRRRPPPPWRPPHRRVRLYKNQRQPGGGGRGRDPLEVDSRGRAAGQGPGPQEPQWRRQSELRPHRHGETVRALLSRRVAPRAGQDIRCRTEEHTYELQSLRH